MPSPLRLLQRTDKWYVGSGDGLVWAPAFPAWHDTPGFWEEAHLAQYGTGPLFTVSFVADGRPLPVPRARRTTWTPAAFTLHYALAPRLAATEIRSAPGNRVLASEWEVRNTGRTPVTLDLVVWTAVDGEAVSGDGVAPARGALRLRRTVCDRKGRERPLTLAWTLVPAHRSWAAYRAEAGGVVPEFRHTPFHDRWQASGALRNEARLGGLTPRGLVYAGIQRRLRLAPRTAGRFTCTVQVTPDAIPVPAGAPVISRTAAAARRGWDAYQAELPAFRCSDGTLERYWWYRWYGLRLNAVPAGLGQYGHRTVCEGIGYFHQPISYSAMAHAREVRWCRDPDWAHGVVETFFDRLGPDGALPGRVYLDHLHEPDFYHADWGGALGDVGAVHPDRSRLARLYPQAARYAEWLGGARDADGSGMIDVVDQYETGQEYMPRYQAVDPEADRYGWENRLRLKGVDVTVYAYRLFRLLERLAPDDLRRARWRALAQRTRSAVHRHMWDPGAGMFFDVNPRTGARTGAKAAVCFYPYLTDLAGPEHVEGFGRHLFDRREFWTAFPVPSSSADDPLFSPDAEWKGKRHVCPWNGRVWPMTNSHVIDALARVVRRHRPAWAARLVRLLTGFLRMMSWDHDPARPNCFEHYHPRTGTPSAYRGIDDYMHSWVNDLLVRHVAGLIPRGEDGILVDPLPFGVDLELAGARVAGRSVDVRVRDRRFQVRVNGRPAARGPVGRAAEVAW